MIRIAALCFLSLSLLPQAATAQIDGPGASVEAVYTATETGFGWWWYRQTGYGGMRCSLCSDD